MISGLLKTNNMELNILENSLFIRQTKQLQLHRHFIVTKIDTFSLRVVFFIPAQLCATRFVESTYVEVRSNIWAKLNLVTITTDI